MTGKNVIFVETIRKSMKKTLLTLLTAALCCLSFSNAYAQRYYDDRGGRTPAYDRNGTVASYLDLHIGEGVGRGAQGFGGANLAFLYRFSSDFQFGVGSGIDYFHALALQGKKGDKNDFDYHGELTLPLYMRGRYYIGNGGYSLGSANFFFQCDLGYRFGLSAYNTGKNSGVKGVAKNFEHCNVKGFFVEPQVGIALNETISFSFGLPFQHYTKNITTLNIANAYELTDFEPKTKELMFMGVDVHFMIGF
jgi:hypothetical protein